MINNQEITENTYYQKLSRRQASTTSVKTRPLRLPQTEASTNRFSYLDYMTEPTVLQLDGPQTDRTYIKTALPSGHQPSKYISYEPISELLQEEKNKLQNKFLLIDSLIKRGSHSQLQMTNQLMFRKFSQTMQLSEENESSITLHRNQFHYTQVKIKDRYSPLLVQVKIKQGDQNTKLRLFASSKYIQPNRFNSQIEVNGKQLKYGSSGETFIEENLYIAILSLTEISISISIEFGRPTTRKLVQRERKEKSTYEFPPDLDLQVEEIMLKRKLRYANSQNYIELNKDISQMGKKIIKENTNVKQIEIKRRIRNIKREKVLKRFAQVQLHDVAHQIHKKQMEMQKNILFRQYVQKSWLRNIILINILVPAIHDLIDTQRQLVAKNMKKQIKMISLLRKLQKKVQLNGPTCKLRTLLQGNYSLKLIAFNSKQFAKQRAKMIVTQILKSNITCFITETKGSHVVNLIKKCANRLVKHKFSRIEFMSNLKLFLSVQYKQLYQIALRYSKLSESNKRRDPIHFLLYDASFLHQMTKKLLNHVFEKWNRNFITFREITKEEREKRGKQGVALFWQPPKLFELPSDIVVRLFLFEELEKRGLITSEYKE